MSTAITTKVKPLVFTHLEQLSALATRVGKQIARVGDGAFIAQSRGQLRLVMSLRAAEVVLCQICGGVAA